MNLKEAARKIMSHKEYEANMAGINIVFGAMVGVVMGNVNEMEPLDYSIFLALVASFVINLLYISASKHRITYACMGAALLAIAWLLAADIETKFNIDPDLFEKRLLPVATVWFLMVSGIEFLPRGKPED